MIERLRVGIERLAAAPRVLRWALALGWMLAIWLSSSLPARGGSSGVGMAFAFNGGHVVLYAILAFLLHLAQGGAGRTRFVVALVVAAAFGLIDEIHQSFVPGRDCSVFDWCSDLSGATLGASIATWLRERLAWALPMALGAAPAALASVTLATFV